MLSRFHHFCSICLLSCICMLLVGCAFDEHFDRKLKLNREEIEEKLLHKKDENYAQSQSNITLDEELNFLPIISLPEEPKIRNDKLVSMTITDDIDIKDVIIELSRLADIDIEIDPKITGGIILHVQDKPLSEVIKRIAKLADLRYIVDNNVLRIERDTPYLHSYQVDFINVVRSNTSNIQTSISMGSSGDSGSLDAGSGTSIESSYTGDLWSEVISNIKAMLSYSNKQKQIDRTVTTRTSSNIATNRHDNPHNDPHNDPQNMIDVSGASEENNEDVINVNKTAGIINVFATSSQHKDVAQYLAKVKATTSAQVLIEAKIVEISLEEEYRSGVNWSLISKGRNSLGGFININQSNNSAPGIMGILRPQNKASVNGNADGVDALLQLTEKFGTVNTLASPRIHAMNNQQALLSFVENQVYFTVDITPGQAGENASTQAILNSSLNTIPLGIILNLQPSINIETSEILMNVRPTITRANKYIKDPALEYILQTQNPGISVTNEIPQIVVRELDSMVRIRSGDIMVIGGVIDQYRSNTDEGVPGVNRMPVVGNMFKTSNKTSRTVETVIFLKATIVDSANIDQNDVQFYKDFTHDPHPVSFPSRM